MTQYQHSRRDFLKKSMAAAAVGSAVPYVAWSPSAFAAASPNDRPHLASIGLGGQGRGDAGDHSRYADIVAVCDVDVRSAAESEETIRRSARVRPTPTPITAKYSSATTSTP